MSCKNLKDRKTANTKSEYGVVKTGQLVLESGEVLPEVELAYERTGNRNGEVILVCHALTGNQYTVGSEESPGWWAGLIGPDKYIDTNLNQVITFNVLGGCSGSTGPLSINPLTNKSYKNSFPEITIRDIVRAQYSALDEMGITGVRAIVGGSLGGMQVLEWGLLYPEFADVLIPLAATPYLSDYGMAFNTIARNAIIHDPSWQDGWYSEGEVIHGLEIARMVGMVTYRTEKMFNLRFERERKANENGNAEFQVESYLKYQGEKLARRFDANSYLRLLAAMDYHDIGINRKGWKEALKSIRGTVLIIGFSGDILYPPYMLKETVETLKNLGFLAEFYEVKTDFGHDGFLAEYSKWGDLIRTALKEAKQGGITQCQPFMLRS